jgi:hypothetical protein
MFNYTLLIYKRNDTDKYDLFKEIPYTGVSGNFMMNEIHFIRKDYPTKDGWLLTFTESE